MRSGSIGPPGRKVEVFDAIQHAQYTCSLFRYFSDKSPRYALGIGAAPEGIPF